MSVIVIQPIQQTQRLRMTAADLPGQQFQVQIPEAIGDTNQSFYVVNVENQITWDVRPDGSAYYALSAPNELDFTVEAAPGEGTVDITINLTNRSNRIWATSHAFTCFNPGNGAQHFTDHELLRTYGGYQGAMIRLIEHSRQPSSRPLVQLYGIEGAPPASGVPFVDKFGATSPLLMEGSLAIVSKDGTGVIGVASGAPLYLFNNLEFSCIHSCPNFGRLEPGQAGSALTRLYMMKATLPEFRARLAADFGVPGAEGEGEGEGEGDGDPPDLPAGTPLVGGLGAAGTAAAVGALGALRSRKDGKRLE